MLRLHNAELERIRRNEALQARRQQVELDRQAKQDALRAKQQEAELEQQRRQAALTLEREQYEAAQNRLEMERAIRREKAAGDAWVVCGFYIPSWLWQGVLVAVVTTAGFCLIRKIFRG